MVKLKVNFVNNLSINVINFFYDLFLMQSGISTFLGRNKCIEIQLIK